MITIEELSKDLGPTRRRELLQANDAYQAAKAELAELQGKLAEQKTSQHALAPATVVSVGTNPSTLGQARQLEQAQFTVIAHLEKEAIPAAQREVDRAGAAVGKLREAIGRRHEDIAGQEKIKAEAQAKIDKANTWLDT